MSIWLLLNSLGLLVVSLVLYLMLRQMGFILRRVGAVGARAASEGPRIGENITPYLHQLSGVRLPDRAKLIVFVSEQCAICAHIKQATVELARSWHAHASILLIYDCTHLDEEKPLAALSSGRYQAHNSGLRTALNATFVPFAIVTDANGRVVSKGLVNDIEHLESLLEAEANARGEAVAAAVTSTALRASV